MECYTLAKPFIECKTRQLVGKYGFRKRDREDIEQELYLDVLQRLENFDSSKAKLATFIQRVVEHKIADLLRQRCSDKAMAERTALSLSMTVEKDRSTGREITLGDCITNEQYDGFVRNRTRYRLEEHELAMDVHEVLAKLPERLRTACELLMEGRSVAETGRVMDMKHATFYEQIFEPLRAVFQETNLEIYFEIFKNPR